MKTDTTTMPILKTDNSCNQDNAKSSSVAADSPSSTTTSTTTSTMTTTNNQKSCYNDDNDDAVVIPTKSSSSSSPSSSHINNTNNNNSNKKKVSFNDDDNLQQIYYIERIEDMPRCEIDSKWYDNFDYEEINNHIHIAVKLMKAEREEPERFGYCYRGLEYKLSKSNKRRKNNMLRVSQALYKEQTRQKILNVNDPELLATIVTGYSNMSIETAIRQGDEDAIIASKIALEPIHEIDIQKRDANDMSMFMFEPIDDDDISVLSDDFADYSSLASDDSSNTGKKLVRRIKRILHRRKSLK